MYWENVLLSNVVSYFGNTLILFNNYIWDILPKGLDKNGTESHVKCLPLQLTDHNTAINLVFLRSA